MRLLLLTTLLFVAFTTFAQSPQVKLNKSSITASIDHGSIMTQTFTITNTGNRDLHWELQFKGMPVTFVKKSSTDYRTAAGQDRITNEVWLTSVFPLSIMNYAAGETSADFDSPLFTTWAFGKAEDVSPGQYKKWTETVNLERLDIFGVQMSMRSTIDDRYFDIVFDPFVDGVDFSYTRRESRLKWMRADLTDGMLIPGESRQITVEIDASSLSPGLHAAKIVIASNDPSTEEKGVDVNLTVGAGTAVPEISADSKNVGPMFLNEVRHDVITIDNNGKSPLVVSDVISSSPTLVPLQKSFTIAPGQGYDLAFKVTPTSIGSYNPTLTIVSNDPLNSQFVVDILADEVTHGPILIANQGAFNQTLESGSTVTQQLVIKNSGVGVLNYMLRMNLGTSPVVTFRKDSAASHNRPENRDRISPSLHLVRSSWAGLYNSAAGENSFDINVSPKNTLWRQGAHDNDRSLKKTFGEYFGDDPWWNVNKLHTMFVPSENRIFEVTLKEWACCSNQGGGFAYERREIYNWLTTSYAGGELVADGYNTLPIEFNAKGLAAGTYEGTIDIRSNDPNMPLVSLPVTMVVTGAPLAKLNSSNIVFRNTVVGESSVAKLSIENNGAAPFTITGVTYGSSHFTTQSMNTVIPAFGAGVIDIRFSPTAAEEYEGQVTITTNDPANPTLVASYWGLGTVAGTGTLKVTVNPEDMKVKLATGESTSRTFTIENTGTGRASWKLDVINTNPVIRFTKKAGTDPNLPENQDRITPTVWLSHDNMNGFVNMYYNETFDESVSPQGTGWSSEPTITNHGSFYWPMVRGPIPGMINVVNGMKAGNEYYEVVMRSYEMNGTTPTGGFSYDRQLTQAWLKSSSGTSASLAPGEKHEIELVFDPLDYNSEVKNEIIRITDNNQQTIADIPVQLTIEGKPVIEVSVYNLNFKEVAVGSVKKQTFTVKNKGTHTLDVKRIASDNPAFTLSHTSASIKPGEVLEVAVTFHPVAARNYWGAIEIISNAVPEILFASAESEDDEYSFMVEGIGVDNPNIQVTPSEIVDLTPASPVSTGHISITNAGSVPLNWNVGQLHELPLEEVLVNLNNNYESVTSAIPSRYDFPQEGSNGVSDGPGGLYRYGASFETNLMNGWIPFYDNRITDGSYIFGPGTKYFTRRLPGLFVAAADLNDLDFLQTYGALKSTATRYQEAFELHKDLFGNHYTAYVRRIFGSDDPSIVQMMIVQGNSYREHTYSSSTSNGLQKLAGLNDVSRIYFVFFSMKNGYSGGISGGRQTWDIFNKFLLAITSKNASAEWLELAEYSGTVAPGETQNVDYTIDLSSHSDNIYESIVTINSNDINKKEVEIPVKINLGAVAVKGKIEDIVVNEGFGTYNVNFRDVFVDGNGDDLWYAVGTNGDVLSGTINGTHLTLKEVGTGKSIVSIRAEDTNGNLAYADFNFRVNDIPSITSPIEDVVLVRNSEVKTIDVSAVFTDNDIDDNVVLTITNSNSSVVTASISNGIITLDNVGVGSAVITLTANDGVGGVAYEIFVVTVKRQPVNIIMSDAITTYDGNPKTISVATEPAGIPVTLEYVRNGLLVANAVDAGEYNVLATVDQPDYEGYSIGSLIIEKATATVTISENAKVYNGATQHVVVETEPAGLNTTVSYMNESGNMAEPIGAGTYNVNVVIDDVNYAGTGSETLIIEKAAQTITFATIADVYNSAEPFSLSASASSGLAVNYNVVSGPVSVLGNTVTLTGDIGDVVIEATQVGNENYFEATSVRNGFTVMQDPILSVDDLLTASTEVWPVPSSDFVNVKTGALTIIRIALVDNMGREIFQDTPMKKEYSLNVASYSQGVYMLKIVTNGGLATRRIQIK